MDTNKCAAAGEKKRIVQTARDRTAENPTVSPMECLTQYYRVDRREIAYIKFVIESYDGVGLLSTVEPQSGLIVIRIPPGCEEVIDDIISDLKRTILIETVAQPS
ncbi:MAG: DUF4911 domain-containing protein [Desulfobacterales bacterium]